MAIDVSALNIFKDEISYGLAKKAVLEADDIKYFDVRTDVNGNLQLNTINSTMLGTNTNCSFTDTGSTVFAGNVLETCDVNFHQDLCAKEANKYWMGKFVAAEQLGESFGSLEEVIMDEKMGVVSHELAKIRWQGSASSPSYVPVSGNLLLCDGLLQKAAELSASTVNVTKSAITAANAITVIDTYCESIPSAIESHADLRLFLSPSDFRAYMVALRNSDFRNFDTNSEGVSEILHPGQIAIKVTKINGLEGVASGTGLITIKDNMVFGTLVAPESLDASLWYSRDERQVKYAFESRAGVQYVHAEHVVSIL